MSDTLTRQQRSWTMSQVRSHDTKPELAVRSLLHRMGYRFTLRRKDLPGNPDVVLPQHRTVIFVHGCFWHRHAKCRRNSMPATHKRYWIEKFARNVRRDRKILVQLRRLGWQVVVVWECQIETHPAKVQTRLEGILG
ncbi:MAG: DNA mismatch endonuclease Vsr [Kiritimatiellaeota bacterium]|nr:DNA mismatch endonuclease Vsr [Kiritimatiellota bacterium]